MPCGMRMGALLLIASLGLAGTALAQRADWPAYGGAGADRYSPLAQIDRSNVGALEQVLGSKQTQKIIGQVLTGLFGMAKRR